MVQFSENKDFTVTIKGNNEDYIELLKVLLDTVFNLNDGESSYNDRYYICNLIKNMLPSKDQIVNIEDANMLKQIKGENKKQTTSFIDSL